MKLGMQVGLGPGHIELDGDPAPPKGHTPQFSAHIRCAKWLRRSRCIGSRFCVRWGPRSPPQ